MAPDEWRHSIRAENEDRLQPEGASHTPNVVRGFHELRDLVEEVEAHLRHIDFEEVTVADRVTYVEYAVAWRVRLALRRGRPDLAVRLKRYGERRIAELEDGAGRGSQAGDSR